jgi:hypothetical protein
MLLKTHIATITIRKTSILDVGRGDTYLIKQLSRKLPLASFIAVDTAFTPRKIPEDFLVCYSCTSEA